MPTYDRVHLGSCLADAVRSAVENLRDDANVSHLAFHNVINGGEYNGFTLYALAYSYLEDGLVRCTCGAIPSVSVASAMGALVSRNEAQCVSCEEAGRTYDPDRHDSENCWAARIEKPGASASTERRSNSILEERENGCYYTGPLDPAMKAMRDEYGSHIETILLSSGLYSVREFRGSTVDNPNQWGTGSTKEEAWRYLIGADFGPLDATYEEEGYEAVQRRMLGLDNPVSGNGASTSTEGGE